MEAREKLKTTNMGGRELGGQRNIKNLKHRWKGAWKPGERLKTTKMGGRELGGQRKVENHKDGWKRA